MTVSENDADLAAAKAVHEALVGQAGAIGPHELNDEGEPLLNRPLDGVQLTEWVVVMAWTDPKSGRTMLTRATSLQLPTYRENGLLHEALYGFD